MRMKHACWISGTLLASLFSTCPSTAAVDTATYSANIQAGALPATDPTAVGFSPDRLALLNTTMHRAVDSGQVAGVLTLLARHGKIVSFDAYGKNNIAAGTPLTRDAIFRLYSQTKPVTGVAMMMLFEQGKWSFDDPIAKFIPEFANLKVFGGLDKKGKPILQKVKHAPTMRMLMTHTAGFGYGFGPFADNYVDKQIQKAGVFTARNLHEMVQRLATVPLRYQPGTKWSYSAAMDIQGYLIEKLSGQRFGDYLAEHLFKPLGMNDTAFFVPADRVSRLAAFYATNPKTKSLIELIPVKNPAVQDYTKLPDMDFGGAGLVSTIDDYARFCQMLLNGGTFNGARILAPATVALMHSDLLPATAAAEDGWQGAPIGGGDLGFGTNFAVMKNPTRMGSLDGAGTFYWGGAAGTWFWVDPKSDLFFLGMIQKFESSDEGSIDLNGVSQTMVYAALVAPEK